MKSAAGKRPPDEAHGPGKEAIRPPGLLFGHSRGRQTSCNVSNPVQALISSQAHHRPVSSHCHSRFSAHLESAPLSIQKFSQISSNFFAFSQSYFQNFIPQRCLKFTNFDENSPGFQHFLRRRPTSVRFSNFLRFRNEHFATSLFQLMNIPSFRLSKKIHMSSSLHKNGYRCILC